MTVKDKKRLLDLEARFLLAAGEIDQLREDLMGEMRVLPAPTVVLVCMRLVRLRRQLHYLLGKIDEPITQRIKETTSC